MDTAIIKLIRRKEDEEETVDIFLNGVVFKRNSKDKIVREERLRKEIVFDLVNQLKESFNLMLINYNDESDKRFEVIYNNHHFYNVDLYLQILLIVNLKKSRNLSIYEYLLSLNKQIEEYNEENNKVLALLDTYEANKKEIDIKDVLLDKDFIDEKPIISFDIVEKYVFDIGKSRLFSSSVDIPDDVSIPEELELVAQINLAELSKYDDKKLLPKTGMLYFLKSPSVLEKHYEFGKVIYSKKMDLKRTYKVKHDEQVYTYTMENISKKIEKYNDKPNVNKVFGFYNDKNMSIDDFKKVSQKYIVLLQIGPTPYGNGITTYLISEEDLKNKNFDNVIYKYSNIE